MYYFNDKLCTYNGINGLILSSNQQFNQQDRVICLLGNSEIVSYLNNTKDTLNLILIDKDKLEIIKKNFYLLMIESFTEFLNFEKIELTVDNFNEIKELFFEKILSRMLSSADPIILFSALKMEFHFESMSYLSYVRNKSYLMNLSNQKS